ncbi:uncharacterized protein LACBIDRAFT_318271 [Laccaria bicolor S238N-H82]|uniref:Predicted protein n=1 Tax=Laccaria bicolor (strain S238N-H82 / ATCC MYA-4686) TaxID=486041 RepID=B0D6C4_LACBS|nr:uncharacterized protein LACBIDRAFT_318271 [Laccaria bicolor S238N-H82]EDR09922.1 predicted protein [Laccaria bicolor S238N-H82]|eukprot:XP_001879307.1 predicted protein [Laccaria bicolor S238N-H82]
MSHGLGSQSALKHTSTQKDSNFTGNSESRRARVSGPGSISSTTSRSAGNLVELELSGPSNYTAVDDYGPIEAEGRPAAIDGQTAGLSAVSSHSIARHRVLRCLSSVVHPILRNTGEP